MELRSILNNNGFGLSVIAKLKETKVKRNLYYEMKDKVIEEVMEHGKIVKKARRTKVYGLYSNHDVRNLLIELLKERVSLHKDKFISPTIYKELTGLEVKRNGKVEHSDLTHDDQRGSYLMAMEGNLKELFGIEKMGIKTEDSVDDIVDLETGPKSQADMGKALISVSQVTDDKNRIKLEADLLQTQKAQGVMYSDFINKQRVQEEQNLKYLLSQQRNREAYARYYGVPEGSVDVDSGKGSYDDAGYSLPTTLYTDFNKTEDELSKDSIYLTLPNDDLTRRMTTYYDEDETLH